MNADTPKIPESYRPLTVNETVAIGDLFLNDMATPTWKSARCFGRIITDEWFASFYCRPVTVTPLPKAPNAATRRARQALRKTQEGADMLVKLDNLVHFAKDAGVTQAQWFEFKQLLDEATR